MPGCARCEGPVEPSHRFCPWCAAPQRLKLTELFRPHPEIESDEAKVLRVSRYLDSPCGRHVRFSIWDESATAVAAVSLDDDEAARLGAWVAGSDRVDRSIQTHVRAEPGRADGRHRKRRLGGFLGGVRPPARRRRRLLAR